MNATERALACLNYEKYDRLPRVHFGWWQETLDAWKKQGHITDADYENSYGVLAPRLGFDYEWGQGGLWVNGNLSPGFDEEVLERLPDGSVKSRDGSGLIVLTKPGVASIPAEIDTSLKTREDWETLYRPRLQFSADRVAKAHFALNPNAFPQPLYCGSLFGNIRNWLGVQGLAYMYADDPDLLREIIDTVGDLCFRLVEEGLGTGHRFAFGHFWEDICFKNGPLFRPDLLQEWVDPHYRRITDLLASHGTSLVSLDCDGLIDELIPLWLDNGVNVMFPIEVGTWGASIAPWRAKYGKALRGVGGMDKRVFAEDRAAVDREIERLRALVDLGGFIPCPDHRIPPDAKFGNVAYYVERLAQVFGA